MENVADGAASSRSWQRWQRALVCAIALAVYAPAVTNGYSLDGNLIADKRLELEGAPFETLFDRQYFDLYNQDTYRPVATASSMIEHRLGVDPAVAGHVQSGLLHAATAVAVHALAAWYLQPVPAFVAALTYAVHPVTSESALCLGYREDLLVSFFLTCALLLTLQGGRGRRALALVSYGLAMFSKESAVVFPALLVLARLTIARAPPLDRRALGRKIGWEVVPFVLLTLAYLAVRFGPMASPHPFSDPVGGTWGASFVAAPRIFAHDLRLFFVPWPLLVQYSQMFPLGGSWLRQVPWIALDAAVVVGAARLVRHRPAIAFGALWFMVALTPTLHLVPMRVEAAVRFVHLSIVGGALAVGGLLEAARLDERTRALRFGAWAGAAAALGGLFALSELRIPVWRTDFALWTDTLRHNPRAYMGRSVMAQRAEERGDLAGARREVSAALVNCPRASAFGRARFCAAYAFMLGDLKLRARDLDGARRSFEEAAGYADNYVPSIVGLGYVDLAEQRISSARQRGALAVRLDPEAPQIRELVKNFLLAIESAELRRRAGSQVTSR